MSYRKEAFMRVLFSIKFMCLKFFVVVATISILFIGYAIADEKYPSRPLEIIVSWPAGGGADIATRTMTKYLEKEIGQRIDVRNIAGGGGAIGYTAGAKKEPDGYHLMTLQSSFLALMTREYVDISFDNFDLVGRYAFEPPALMVKGNSSFKTLEDFIKGAKENKLKVAVAALGGDWHQATHLMSKVLGITVRPVPFKGITGALPAILGGHVDAGVVYLSGTTGSMKSGDVRLIAVMSKERLKRYPNVPTFKELGYDVTYTAGFYGVGAPKGTPSQAISMLTQAIDKVCKNPDFVAEAASREQNILYLAPNDFKMFLEENLSKVEMLMKELGVK
jgi:tripartite-type tricarboxylate transporter receptor subunit TctC